MKQIRIHGRGGQGVVTAAELIAISAFYEGKESQAFPSFGVERTGAPIESYVRIDKHPIRTREQVYGPDILIIQDATLLDTTNVTKGCDKNTIAIINSAKNKSEIDIDLPDENVFVINATKIALDIIGKNIVNTVILGSIAKDTGLFSLASAKKAIKQKFEGKDKSLVEKNIKAVEVAFKN
ncbi:MAG: 2-oxoacid:acceptor oxidoreductase family protein [Patescibacteria group bacterium]|jgi:pyruvate ferredoxin oxidoreductase gamma subunit|nr:2-oxoacid:acceptor oxidoreductase family protein [Patescibacteria group bacterium]